MSDYTTLKVSGQPEWLLTPKAWGVDGTAIGYELTDNTAGPIGGWPTVVTQDGDILTWWEQPRLYYRSTNV